MNAIPGISSSDLLPALEIQTIAIADGPAFIAPNVSLSNEIFLALMTSELRRHTFRRVRTTREPNPSSRALS